MTWRSGEINVGTIGGSGGGVDPGQQPTVSIDFTASTIGAATLESDTRWYRNASTNLVSTAGARFHCDTLGDVQGILLERANKGWLRHNAAFASANGWTHKDINLTSTSRADVFGGSTAYEIEENSSNVTHAIYRTLPSDPADIADNLPVCIWADIKYVDLPYVQLQFRDKANRFPWQRYNIHPDTYGLHTAFAGSAIHYASGIEYRGNSWFRIWASFDTVSATTAVHPTAQLFGVNAAGNSAVYAGTGRSFILSAFCANEGYYPQEFFTVGATHVTKTGDALTLPASNQAANDFYVNMVLVARDVSRITGTAERRCLYQSGDFYIDRTATGLAAGFGALELTATHTFVAGSRYNIAVGKGPTNGLAIYVNGVEKAANTTLPYRANITPGTIYIGSDSSQERQIDAVIESIELGAWE